MIKELLFGFCGFWVLGLGVAATGALVVTVQIRTFPGSPFDHPGIIGGMLCGVASMLVLLGVLFSLVTVTRS